MSHHLKGEKIHLKLMGIICFLGACDTYKITVFDNRDLVSFCVEEAECEMEQLEDADYDIEDEDVYYTYLVEACVDDYYDDLRIRKEEGCSVEHLADRAREGDDVADVAHGGRVEHEPFEARL